MQRKRAKGQSKGIPAKAVLLIPEPENEGEPALYGIKPGYYDAKQLLRLLEEHQTNADAIRFIADMLDTGDAESDGFAAMLRANCRDDQAICRIIHNARG